MADVAAITDRYDRHALRYDRWWGPVLEPTALSLLDRVAASVRGSPPARVLDVGTGTGVLARGAVERWPAATVVGLDGSAGMLAVARGRAERHPGGHPGRLDWIAAVADRLPFDDGAFDVVLSSFVYQLVPDRLAALREAHRVLAPGGTLGYVTWLTADDDFAPQQVFDDLLDEERIDGGEEDDDLRSGDLVSVAAGRAQLRRAGFVDVQARMGWLEHSWTARSYLHFLERYEAADLFESLDPAGRERLHRLAERRLARLAPGQFAWRAPVFSALARAPSGRRPAG